MREAEVRGQKLECRRQNRLLTPIPLLIEERESEAMVRRRFAVGG